MASLRGVGAGLQAVADTLGPDIQDAIVRRRQAAQNKVIAEREAAAEMLRAKIAALSNKDPEVRQRMSTAFPQMGVPQPSQSEFAAAPSAQISKASNLSELQTPQDIAGGLSTTPPSDVESGDTETASTSLDRGPNARTQSILSLLTQNQAKKDSLMAGMTATRRNEPLSQDYYDEQGVKMNRQTTKGAAEDALPTQVEPTGVQAGQKIKEEKIGGDLNPDVTKLEALRESQMTSAREGAQHPYSTPTILTDAEGKDHAFRWGPKGPEEIPLPAGMMKSGGANVPQRPSATQVGQFAAMNAAETNGVKVLGLLKKTGLDTSNDPVDPRWNNFLVTQLKVSPEDVDRQTIQQRVAFINAILMRNLLQGRPSQYIAQIIQQHLPNGKLSGQLLNQVILDVLDETGDIRDETTAILHQKPGTFDPVSGTTYKQWQSLTQSKGANAPGGSISSGVLGR